MADNIHNDHVLAPNDPPNDESTMGNVEMKKETEVVTIGNAADVQQIDKGDEDQGIVVNASDMPQGFPAAKKKKRKPKKPASKRGLGKPTGFEDFHADAPLTAEQYAESKKAFTLDQPFVDRVLKAIQRFERTRKMSPERRDIFYKYLAYGGVDIGPNMFVGRQDTENMDNDEINAALTHANISDETKKAIVDPKQVLDAHSTTPPAHAERSRLHSPEYIAKYIVDFEATMRGFLSRYAPILYAFDKIDDVKLITTTLERFMDYLLQHDVCPEYAVEVLNTRNLCRAAQTELWHCAEAERYLPGDFNVACSTLFGGAYGHNYDGENYWGPSEESGNVFIGYKPEQATQIVGFAIAGAATEDVYTRYLEITTGESAGKGFEVVNVITDHGFEIVEVEQPTQECRDLYQENTSDFQPVGRVYAKFFHNPEAPPEDMSPAEEASLTYDKDHDSTTHEHNGDTFVFFVEADKIFPYLRPGMRVEATLYELNCGVWFFDEVIRVLPSFDLWLENELMLGWKEPRPVAGVPELPWNIVGEKKPGEITNPDSGENGVGNGDHELDHAIEFTNNNGGQSAEDEYQHDPNIESVISNGNNGDDSHPY